MDTAKTARQCLLDPSVLTWAQKLAYQTGWKKTYQGSSSQIANARMHIRKSITLPL